MSDPVNHPAHYTSSPARCQCGRQIECIDVVRHMLFAPGNAVKYLWRAYLKGDPIENLRKARWYIDDEIARLEAEAKPLNPLTDTQKPDTKRAGPTALVTPKAPRHSHLNER